MAVYRKKPVKVEAMQYKGESNYKEVCDFVGQELIMEYVYDENGQNILIPTLEGELSANKGDYIIKGIQGEFYPCEESIFKQTYELVE